MLDRSRLALQFQCMGRGVQVTCKSAEVNIQNVTMWRTFQMAKAD